MRWARWSGAHFPRASVMVHRDNEAAIRVHREDETGAYLETASKGYNTLRLKDAEIIGVVVESRRTHR